MTAVAIWSLALLGPLFAALPNRSPKESRRFQNVTKPIVTAVNKTFAPADVRLVLAEFNNSKHWGVHKRPRVQAAVIILAEGNMGKFRKALKDANLDWRDVLVWSGLGHANWPKVAAKKGVPGLRD